MPKPQTPSPTDPTLLTAVSEAIAKADKHRKYGAYDFTNYPGDAPPFVIKDEDTGAVIYRGWDGKYCASEYDRLTKEWVGQCAIKAMEEWLAADVAKRLVEFNRGALWG